MMPQTTKLSWKEAVEFMTEFSLTPEKYGFALYELRLCSDPDETYGFSMEAGMFFSSGVYAAIIEDAADFNIDKYITDRIAKQRQDAKDALESGNSDYFLKRVYSPIEIRADAIHIKNQLDKLVKVAEQYRVKYGYQHVDDDGNLIEEED